MTNESGNATSGPLKVGLIGAGRHTQYVLIPCLELTRGVELAGLATSRRETADMLARQYRTRGYVGYESLLADPEIDAVFVATQSSLLEEIIAAALQAGKHVFSETQGIMTPEGAAKIRKLVDGSGLVLQIGYQRPYAPIYQKAKQLLGPWREREAAAFLWETRYYRLTHHHLNLMLFLNGQVGAVSGFGGETATVWVLEFANGDLGSLTSGNLHTPWPQYEHVTISSPKAVLSTRDCVELRYTGQMSEVYPYEMWLDTASETVWRPNLTMPNAVGTSTLYLSGYLPGIEDFVRCIREGCEPLCGLDLAEATMWLKRTAEEATRTGRKLAPGDV